MHETVAQVSKIPSRNDDVALEGLISPYREFRRCAQEMIEDFVEVYVICSLDGCIDRGVKGHYRKALSGEIKNITGVSDPYEEPENPEVTVDTENETPEKSAEKILSKLQQLGYLHP